jgi:hypothetical protein
MARFKMDDGSVVDTSKARLEFEEERRWNGRNHVSLATNDQWVHETLYCSAKRRWYIVTESQWQGSTPSARFISNEEAARWLLVNEYGVGQFPEELAECVEAVME